MRQHQQSAHSTEINLVDLRLNRCNLSVMADVITGMQVGDFIRNFSLPSTTGKPATPNDFLGKSVLMFFYANNGGQECMRQLCGFRDLYPEFEKLGVSIVGIAVASEESQKALATANNLPFALLSDVTGQMSRQFGVIPKDAAADQSSGLSLSTTYLFTPDFRVAKAYYNVQSSNHATEALEDAKRILLREEPRQMLNHAPILLIPNVLPPDMCKTLIELWETHNEESGFMKQVDGKTVGLVDYGHKIRRDHFIKPGEIQTRVQSYMSSRLVPEVRKAFNYAVTRREDFRVACYDASKGGFFRPHRDNTTDATAHRRFAMSLLLNNEYEGGFLRFPEYGKHTYRPEAGGAVIFSCSLLHEATDITAGRRFVLLSFLYGEAEAKAREEYNKRVGGAYKA
jgi:peroxiredoxin/predicted 2-oxoglutarate/Fe(II)-dependent dioxygenase YbiX